MGGGGGVSSNLFDPITPFDPPIMEALITFLDTNKKISRKKVKTFMHNKVPSSEVSEALIIKWVKWAKENREVCELWWK